MSQVYGYTNLVAQSQTAEGVSGANPAEPAFFAGAACMVNASFFDGTGGTMIPAALAYRIDDETSGATILDWTTLSPASIVSIEISAAQNEMVSNSLDQERHIVTVQLTDPSGDGPFEKSCGFLLRRPPTVL